MSYTDLPLEKRIEMASQYALLLVADNKPTLVIIDIIKRDFALTEEQAAQAVGALRINYKNEYDSIIRSNFFKVLGGLGFSLFGFLVYYFIGKDMGRAGVFSMIFAIIFALGGVAALFIMGRIVAEKFRRLPKSGSPARELDDIDKALRFGVIISSFPLCFTSYEYFTQARTVSLTKVVTVNNCIITEPVRRDHTGGKNRSDFYILKFRGSNLDFRLFHTYYKYSNGAFQVAELKQWDTVSIQVHANEYAVFRDQYITGNLDIVNLGMHGRFLIDHHSRNAMIRKDQKSSFYLFLAFFAGIMPFYFFKQIYSNRKHRAQYACSHPA